MVTIPLVLGAQETFLETLNYKINISTPCMPLHRRNRLRLSVTLFPNTCNTAHGTNVALNLYIHDMPRDEREDISQEN